MTVAADARAFALGDRDDAALPTVAGASLEPYAAVVHAGARGGGCHAGLPKAAVASLRAGAARGGATAGQPGVTTSLCAFEPGARTASNETPSGE